MKTVMKSESQSESYSLPFHCAIGGYVGQTWGDSVGPDVGKGGTIKNHFSQFMVGILPRHCFYEITNTKIEY